MSLRLLPPTFTLLASALALLALAPLAFACANPALPPGAFITCESNEGCPPGTSCAAALGRCVDDSDDRDAPFLIGNATPAPATAGRDVTLTLELGVNEPLGRPPDVVAKLGRIALPPFSLVEADEDGLTYRFEYTAAGDEPEGVASVEAVLVDESGNVATVPAGSFALDFVAPALLADVTTSIAFANAGAEIDATVTFDEELAGEPTVTLVALDDDASAVAAPLPMTFRADSVFRYVVQGDEPEGLYAVRVRAADAAGNELAVVTGTTVTLDFTPPEPVFSSIDGSVMLPGELLIFNLHFSEAVRQERPEADGSLVLAPTATAYLRGGPIEEVTPLEPFLFPTPDNVLFVHRIRDCDTPGEWDVTVTDVYDLAGNLSPPMENPAWSFTIGGQVCPP